MRESRSARYETVDFERCIGFADIVRSSVRYKFAERKLALNHFGVLRGTPLSRAGRRGWV